MKCWLVFFIGTWFFQSCYSCNLETATRLVEQCILLWATTFLMFLYRNKLTYFRLVQKTLKKNHKNTIKINDISEENMLIFNHSFSKQACEKGARWGHLNEMGKKTSLQKGYSKMFNNFFQLSSKEPLFNLEIPFCTNRITKSGIIVSKTIVEKEKNMPKSIDEHSNNHRSLLIRYDGGITPPFVCRSQIVYYKLIYGI